MLIESMKSGSARDAKEFQPGLNNFTCTGPVCITYIDRESGGLVSTFVVDLGFNRLRVPAHCAVDIDAHEEVQWFVHKNDVREKTDTTPVDLPVASARSMRDQIRDMAISIISDRLNIAREEVELPEDFADFAVEHEDHIPFTLGELKVMQEDAELKRIAALPPAEPSSLALDQPPPSETPAKPKGNKKPNLPPAPEPEDSDDSA